jgi:hypothetical protein
MTHSTDTAINLKRAAGSLYNKVSSTEESMTAAAAATCAVSAAERAVPGIGGRD